MSWTIERQHVGEHAGEWYYEGVQSAYGLICGYALSLPEAKVRLAISEAELLEAPYPPRVIEAMLADPEHFAADWPDP